MIRPLLALLLVSSMSSLAPAQESQTPPRAFEGSQIVWPEFPDSPPGAPDARLRIVFDPVSMSQLRSAEVGVPFEAFVLAHDIQVSLRGWEAKLLIDERLKVVDKELLADLDLGKWPEVRAALSNLDDCTQGSPVVLGKLTLLLTEEAEDLVLGFAAVERPSYPTAKTDLELPCPVYLVCREETDIRPFDACGVCAVVNPVAVEPELDESTQEKNPFAPATGRH